jgi:hypothetical protein
MTPKEKAIELVNKYATYVVMWTGGLEVERQNCKQCALIAVNEILIGYMSNPKISYWQSIYEEIEKL